VNLHFKFLGTGAAENYPSFWCRCSNCEYARTHGGRNIRRSSAAMLNHKILIDLPAEIYMLADQYQIDIPSIRNIIITHGHADHFHTNTIRWRYMEENADDTSYTRLPTRFGSVPELSVFASERNIARLRATLTFGPEDYFNIRFTPLKTGQKIVIDGVTVTPLPSSHPVPDDTPFNFLFESNGSRLLYLVDSDSLLPQSWELLAGVKIGLVISECTAWDRNDRLSSGHMNLTKINFLWEEAKRRNILTLQSRLVLTHLSHLSPPYQLLKRVPLLEKADIAYDGYELSL
jgi:phosphoribosyl 1,2-cyclic phosphate phosphodiesterase